jgi:hypothetical protein
MPEGASREALLEAVAEFERLHRALLPSEKAGLLSEPSIDRFRQNARVGALSRRSPEVLNALNGKSLVTGLVRKNSRLLLASQPVVRFGGHLNDESTELWLPIHPNVVVIYVGQRIEPRVIDVPDRFVRTFNQIAARQSKTFSGRSAALITANVRRLRPSAG